MPFPSAVSITVKGMPLCTDPNQQSEGVVSAVGHGGNARGPNNPANWYDGFSGFKMLTNNEPPLAMRYSHPIKCKLTSEV